MSTQMFLVIGATGKTGRHTVRHLLEKGRAVRAMAHKEDKRSEALRRTGTRRRALQADARQQRKVLLSRRNPMRPPN
jgi:uncharacterized protein YbjT (DUF2867 family)